MKVCIRLEVFESEEAWFDLPRLLDHFLLGRHTWDLANWPAIENSPWLTRDPNNIFTRRFREIFDKCLNQTAYLNDDRDEQLLSIGLTADSAGAILTLTAAYYVLSQPAWIVVENGESDGAFLAAMSVGCRRTRIAEALRHRWLKLLHAGGGGELIKRVRDLLAERYQSTRILVLVDSDRLHPNEPQTAKVKKLCADCAASKVPVFVLSKREIENYLPVSALAERAGTKRYRATYQAFLHLSQWQRDFYDMKVGFERDQSSGRANIAPEQQSLYPSDKLPRGVLDSLCGGFGEQVWRLFQSPGRAEAGRQEVGAEAAAKIAIVDVDRVNRDTFTREAIESLYSDTPGQVAEIDALLDQIERML